MLEFIGEGPLNGSLSMMGCIVDQELIMSPTYLSVSMIQRLRSVEIITRRMDVQGGPALIGIYETSQLVDADASTVAILITM